LPIATPPIPRPLFTLLGTRLTGILLTYRSVAKRFRLQYIQHRGNKLKGLMIETSLMIKGPVAKPVS